MQTLDWCHPRPTEGSKVKSCEIDILVAAPLQNDIEISGIRVLTVVIFGQFSVLDGSLLEVRGPLRDYFRFCLRDWRVKQANALLHASFIFRLAFNLEEGGPSRCETSVHFERTILCFTQQREIIFTTIFVTNRNRGCIEIFVIPWICRLPIKKNKEFCVQ